MTHFTTQDGLERLKLMEQTTGIWKMRIRLTVKSSLVTVSDINTGNIIEESVFIFCFYLFLLLLFLLSSSSPSSFFIISLNCFEILFFFLFLFIFSLFFFSFHFFLFLFSLLLPPSSPPLLYHHHHQHPARFPVDVVKDLTCFQATNIGYNNLIMFTIFDGSINELHMFQCLGRPVSDGVV